MSIFDLTTKHFSSQLFYSSSEDSDDVTIDDDERSSDTIDIPSSTTATINYDNNIITTSTPITGLPFEYCPNIAKILPSNNSLLNNNRQRRHSRNYHQKQKIDSLFENFNEDINMMTDTSPSIVSSSTPSSSSSVNFKESSAYTFSPQTTIALPLNKINPSIPSSSSAATAATATGAIEGPTTSSSWSLFSPPSSPQSTRKDIDIKIPKRNTNNAKRKTPQKRSSSSSSSTTTTTTLSNSKNSCNRNFNTISQKMKWLNNNLDSLSSNSSSSSSTLTNSTESNKKRKLNQSGYDTSMNQQYLLSLPMIYGNNYNIDDDIGTTTTTTINIQTLSNRTNCYYSSLNAMLHQNQPLYSALMIHTKGDDMVIRAIEHCRNTSNIDLLEWSEAILIQLCMIKNTALLSVNWRDLKEQIVRPQWMPVISSKIHEFYGQSTCLLDILEKNHEYKIANCQMSCEYVFRNNRKPAINIQLLQTIQFCKKPDMNVDRKYRNLNNIPMNICNKNKKLL